MTSVWNIASNGVGYLAPQTRVNQSFVSTERVLFVNPAGFRSQMSDGWVTPYSTAFLPTAQSTLRSFVYDSTTKPAKTWLDPYPVADNILNPGFNSVRNREPKQKSSTNYSVVIDKDLQAIEDNEIPPAPQVASVAAVAASNQNQTSSPVPSVGAYGSSRRGSVASEEILGFEPGETNDLGDEKVRASDRLPQSKEEIMQERRDRIDELNQAEQKISISEFENLETERRNAVIELAKRTKYLNKVETELDDIMRQIQQLPVGPNADAMLASLQTDKVARESQQTSIARRIQESQDLIRTIDANPVYLAGGEQEYEEEVKYESQLPQPGDLTIPRSVKAPSILRPSARQQELARSEKAFTLDSLRTPRVSVKDIKLRVTPAPSIIKIPVLTTEQNAKLNESMQIEYDRNGAAEAIIMSNLDDLKQLEDDRESIHSAIQSMRNARQPIPEAVQMAQNAADGAFENRLLRLEPTIQLLSDANPVKNMLDEKIRAIRTQHQMKAVSALQAEDKDDTSTVATGDLNGSVTSEISQPELAAIDTPENFTNVVATYAKAASPDHVNQLLLFAKIALDERAQYANDHNLPVDPPPIMTLEEYRFLLNKYGDSYTTFLHSPEVRVRLTKEQSDLLDLHMLYITRINEYRNLPETPLLGRAFNYLREVNLLRQQERQIAMTTGGDPNLYTMSDKAILKAQRLRVDREHASITSIYPKPDMLKYDITKFNLETFKDLANTLVYNDSNSYGKRPLPADAVEQINLKKSKFIAAGGKEPTKTKYPSSAEYK